MQEKSWLPDHFKQKRANLEVRQQVMRAIRRFFDDQDFAEVETPILQVCPVMDTHIRAFATDLRGVDGEMKETIYLHTSPEFAMKKILVAGMPRIYQICHVFRNAEFSKRHRPEFTMIEWYRAQADYTHIMEDCVGMLRSIAEAVGIRHFTYKDMKCDPFAEWERLSVCEAFQRYAEIDLEQYLDDTDGFREAVRGLGLHTAADDAWDDLFFRVMDDRIEPFLGRERPAFLCDYPVSMASLSRKKPEDSRFAERFELYICGVELGNAFSELTDATEQRKRFEIEMAEKERIYGERYPVDEDFIEALEYGMPESGGIAVGIDRIVMLACGTDDIEKVLWV